MHVNICGFDIELLSERALWISQRRTLVISDLQLGPSREIAAQTTGDRLGAVDRPMRRLLDVANRVRAKRLIVLGDLQLDPSMHERFLDWRNDFTAPWFVVRPQIDETPPLPPDWGVTEAEDFLDDPPFLFCHSPVQAMHRFAWCGFKKPVVAFETSTEHWRLPCFELNANSGYLPAFTHELSGTAVKPRSGLQLFAIAGHEVIAI